MGFVRNLLLFPAVKEFWKPLRNDKLSPRVWCTTFWDTVCIHNATTWRVRSGPTTWQRGLKTHHSAQWYAFPVYKRRPLALNFDSQSKKTEILGPCIWLSSVNNEETQILVTWPLLSRSWRNSYRDSHQKMGRRPTNPRWRTAATLNFVKC